MSESEQATAELYAQREKRLTDAIALRQPDRVPTIFYSTFWAARQAGMTCEQAMYDYKGLSNAMREAIVKLQPDAYMPCHAVIALGPTMEKLGFKQLQWPGDGTTNPDVSFQYLDREYMSAKEYDDYLADPTSFYLHKYLPRLADGFEPLTAIPDYPSLHYTRILHTLVNFAQPEFREGIERLIQSGEEVQTMMEEARCSVQELKELGFPIANAASGTAPFDVISDYMRGSKGGMLDMFRNKEKLLAAMELAADAIPRNIVKTAGRLPSKIVFIPLHWGLDGFMSPDQFETFFWPTLQKVICTLVDAGLNPCLFWEGDCTSRLEIIKDIPVGKCIYFFERTDIFKAKEILGDTVCIRGGMPVNTLINGTPDQVRERCKELIDVVGDGGGFIMDAGVGIPDEAKAENVEAMFEFTREYGVYG